MYFFSLPQNQSLYVKLYILKLYIMLTSASTGAFLFGGNAMVRRTAGTAQTSPPPVRLGTAGLVSFSATMETAPVRTFCVTPTRTVTTDQMKTLCSVVGFLFIF